MTENKNLRASVNKIRKFSPWSTVWGKSVSFTSVSEGKWKNNDKEEPQDEARLSHNNRQETVAF
jgi:hypothetical protein